MIIDQKISTRLTIDDKLNRKSDLINKTHSAKKK